jgi:hypothetical protein
MNVYIQQMDGQFQDDWVFAAFLGASKCGFRAPKTEEYPRVVYRRDNEIIFFESDTPEGELGQILIPKSNKNMVIADIDQTLAYFDRIGVKYPEPLNVPKELEIYAERDFAYTTIGELKAKKDTFTFPLFMKPRRRLKQCPAGVITNVKNIELTLAGIPDDVEIVVSGVLDMVSEYRCFVQEGNLVGIQHYQGDFRIFPDMLEVQNMIRDYKSAPSAYTLDVAIVPIGRETAATVIVECNDGWSVGHYGLEAKTYFKFLRTRWNDLMRTI